MKQIGNLSGHKVGWVRQNERMNRQGGNMSQKLIPEVDRRNKETEREIESEITKEKESFRGIW